MSNSERASAIELITKNIAKYGYHVYSVSGGPSPRFVYTVGLLGLVQKELIFAGGAYYPVEDVKRVVDVIASKLRQGEWPQEPVTVDSIGSFSLRIVHESWVPLLLLGVVDYYPSRPVTAYQIVPDLEHMTLDVPNLEAAWNASSEPCWRWLCEVWSYPVSPQSVAMTNLDALRGQRVTEATRWEDDQWELFAGAGPDVAKEDVRAVPLGTLLAVDDSLSAVLGLEIGKGLWREVAEREWHAWG